MNPCSIGGLWTHPTGFSDEGDFTFIEEERRRIITLVIAGPNSLKRLAMRVWYEPLSANSISARMRASDP